MSSSGAIAFPDQALNTAYARRPIAEFYPTEYGDKSASFTNVVLAITDIVNNHNGVGKIVLKGALNWSADTTLNLSNIHPSWDDSSGPSIQLEGYGHLLTTVSATAGLAASGYGFAELVGSNVLAIKGITFTTGANTLEYGILTGRTTGDASSGRHVFEDVYIHGNFGVAGIFGLSSESCTFRNVEVLTNAGHAMVSARDLSGWSITAKYTPLTATIPENGGNGATYFDGVRLYTTRLPTIGVAPFAGGSGDSPLVVEFPQAFVGENVYTLTGGAPHIWLNKGCNQFQITGLQQELNSGTAPTYGVYVTNWSAVTYPNDNKVVRIALEDCSIFPIFGETGVTFSQLKVRGGFRTTMPGMAYQVDVDLSDLCELPISPKVIGSWETPPVYRSRSGSTHITRDAYLTAFGAAQTDTPYLIPSNAKMLHIRAQGGAGGSGSGARRASGTATSGGASGGTGGSSERWINVTDLPANTTTLYVTVGAAGASGAAITTDNTDGQAGTNGSPSYVATSVGGANRLVTAAAGFGGAGGAAATNSVGGFGGIGQYNGLTGAGCPSGGAGATTSATANNSPGVGGSGGGCTAGAAATAGGNGSGALVWTTSGAAGGAPGANGTAGSPAPSAQAGPGTGGGGGGSSVTAVGGAGGQGFGGASGGGGGSSINGFSSGAGGTSSPGFVTVTAYF